MNSAKIDIIPHQFRPVLKFLKADQPRLLIADGVGVGKTIEAGLILKELEARNDIESVLIICPKPLVSEQKWEREMKVRFGEYFTPLNSKSFRQAIQEADNGSAWDMNVYGKIIIPYSLFTEDKLTKYTRYPGLLELEEPPKFDLVIVDEAHHIRNPSTWAYKATKYFIDNADAALLLTATPIQMGEEDLFTLLNLIRPDIVPDIYTFRQMSSPNPFINSAIAEIRTQEKGWKENALTCMKTAGQTLWGQEVYPNNATFRKVMEDLQKDELSDDERITLLSNVESLHTFFSILNRTRRRDIDNFYATRKPVTIETPFTPEQKQVYDKVVEIQKEILAILQPDTPAAFMINTLQRRAASCLPGLIPFLEHVLMRNINQEDLFESDYYSDSVEVDISAIRKDVDRVLEMARKLSPYDEKYEKMLDVLKEKSRQKTNKVMIFSSFRHTLGYLAEKLIADNFRVGVIHGSVADEDRLYLRDRFKLPKEDDDAIDIMLFSEVGCEGLDYQFCDCMINYDLPWNPMKIEQRIGRIDRTGQKSETVSIFNLITPDTVDAEIYHRCLVRIGIFERAIGGNEEILGKIADELKTIGDNFELSDGEKQERLEQLKDNAIRKYHESETLAEAQSEFLGLSLSTSQLSRDLENATNFWLSPESIENLIQTYFRKRFDYESEFIIGSGKSRKLRINQKFRNLLYEDFSNLNPKPEHKPWKKWLLGKDKDKSPYYQVYFDSRNAVDGVGELITNTHPLVKQAISYMKLPENLCTSITVKANEIPEGEYPFAIYLWDYSGILKNQKLIPISENKDVQERLLDFLRVGCDSGEMTDFPTDKLDVLENAQYAMWNAERDRHKQEITESITSKMESLKQSKAGKIASINEQIRNAKDANILRMKNDELKNIQEDLERSLASLKKTETTADVESSLVGYGMVYVKHE